MARMFNNAEIPRRDYGDSLKLINCILESDVTYQITQDISDFILSSLVETDKYIKVADGHFVTEKKGEVQMEMCENTGKPFIATLYIVLLALDLYVQIFSIILLMDLGHT